LDLQSFVIIKIIKLITTKEDSYMTDSMSINTSMNVTGTPVSNTISTPPTQVPAVQTKTDKTAAVSSEDATKQPATSTLVTTDGNAEKAVSIHGDTLEISSQGMDKAKDMIR
jgi:hypothetical protein